MIDFEEVTAKEHNIHTYICGYNSQAFAARQHPPLVRSDTYRGVR